MGISHHTWLFGFKFLWDCVWLHVHVDMYVEALGSCKVSPSVALHFFPSETGSHYGASVGLKFTILRPASLLPPEHWDKSVPSKPPFSLYFETRLSR